MCKGPGAECAPEQWSEQGAQLGQGAHTAGQGVLGQGEGLGSWVVAPGSVWSFKARLHLQKPRAGEVQRMAWVVRWDSSSTEPGT